MTVPYSPAQDSLGYTGPLPHRARFPLLGLPLVVRSNSPAVMEAAERAFGPWRRLPRKFIDPIRPLDLTLVVHPPDHAPYRPQPFIFRVYGDCFLAASGGNLLMAQRDRGVAVGLVTSEIVADDALFRYQVLECMALWMASRHDRTPVHGAALLANGRAVLLLGPSLAGKSTLSYACLRAGFQLLAEDVVFVSSQKGLKLWGHTRQISLTPAAPAIFPELADIPAKTLGNGKVKLTVDLSPEVAAPLNPHAGGTIVCLLQRHPARKSGVKPLEVPQLVQALRERAEPGFRLDPRMPELVAAMARGNAYRFTNGHDLPGAVALIKQLAQ